jgi:hypothetical protein
MTNFITVVETNPVIFVQQIAQKVSEGWNVDCLRQYGSISVTGSLFEVNMYDDVVPREFDAGSVYNVDVYSPAMWLEHICDAVQSGYAVVESSIQYDTTGKKQCVLVSTNDELNTLDSKEALGELSWEALKELGDKVQAERNRLRNVYTLNIIRKLNSRRELLGLSLIEE